MAFASVGTLGSTSLGDQNQTAVSLTTATTNAVAGNLVVVCVAVDNHTTGADGDEGAVSSVTDSASNTYTKAKEFANTQATLQGGAVISIWYSVLTSNLSTGGTITANYTNNSSRDDSCICAHVFSFSGTVALDGAGATLASDAFADTGSPFTFPSLDYTTSGTPRLRIRGFAREYGGTLTGTATSGWTQLAPLVHSSTTAANSQMSMYSEFKISSSTTDASAPTASASIASSDFASAHIAFYEVTKSLIWSQHDILTPFLVR